LRVRAPESPQVARVRPAASVLLARRDAGAATELFVVERSPKLRYFGGYSALPGGTTDPADASLGVEAARVTAARELFEETGVLLARPRGAEVPAGDLAAARRRLLAGEVGFPALLAELELQLATEALQPLCTITTPPFAPVRFATDFFWSILPPGAVPSIVEGELVGGRFVGAEEALAAWRAGELALAPPILILLRGLAALPAGASLADLAIAARSLDGEPYGSPGRRIYFSPGVQILPLPTRTKPPASHTNTLLVGERLVYVVDPAPADEAAQAQLWAAIDGLLAEGAELGGFLLTHHHPDHVGALGAAVSRYRLPVMAHQRTLDRLTLPAGAEARSLADGDVLALGASPDGREGWQLTAWHTPGHARGHLVFHESRYGALLAGDLVSTLSTVVIDPPEGHLATYLASLEGLLADPARTIGTLYPGHGPAVRDGRGVLRQALAHRRERLAKLSAALTAAPATLDELLPRVYDDVDPALWPLAERSLAAGLEHLAERGVAAQAGDAWQATAARSAD
jgi:glyoxylase-like metal-dependent hydrolase (beta-lactamase superfamily II)/8-oxo-dGTP pyrophosphatase MutT (NUDIX family)